jgi:hypothetical protein
MTVNWKTLVLSPNDPIAAASLGSHCDVDKSLRSAVPSRVMVEVRGGASDPPLPCIEETRYADPAAEVAVMPEDSFFRKSAIQTKIGFRQDAWYGPDFGNR